MQRNPEGLTYMSANLHCTKHQCHHQAPNVPKAMEISLANPESYRLISLLPSLPKLWERTIANRINAIFRQSNILPIHQFGFREGHSTVEQVHRLVKYILQAFDDSEYSKAVFIDMQHAFDKVFNNIK